MSEKPFCGFMKQTWQSNNTPVLMIPLNNINRLLKGSSKILIAWNSFLETDKKKFIRLVVFCLRHVLYRLKLAHSLYNLARQGSN